MVNLDGKTNARSASIGGADDLSTGEHLLGQYQCVESNPRNDDGDIS